MRTLSTHAKTDSTGRLRLDLATDMPESDVEVLVVLQPAVVVGKNPKRLLALTGKLSFTGDAMLIQKEMRDEWPE